MTTESQKANSGLYLVILCLLVSPTFPRSSPVVPRLAIPPAGQATATTGQETAPGAGGDLATIIRTGSTNTRAYNVVIHNDGSATAVVSATANVAEARRDFPTGTIDTRTLRSLLAAIGDVSSIPVGFCLKPASFGTTTLISYAGKKSKDLQCIPQQTPREGQALLRTSQELGKFVRTTLNQLKIDARRVIPNQ